MQDLAKLRKELRKRRRALSAQEQRHHGQAMAKRLCRSPLFLNSRRIALYLQEDGEISTDDILTRAQELKKSCYLPVLRPLPQQALWFAEYSPGDGLWRNRFGIYEPCIHKHPPTPPWGLDLILLPLVAFDTDGNRLGMGGGFYDRTLSYFRNRRFWRTPKLIGVAYEIQKVSRIKRMPWDIPLDGVVTEKNFYRW